MEFRARHLGAAAGMVMLAGCNQTHQARLFDDDGASLIRQWQAEAALLPAQARGRYLADRMAGMFPDATLDTCPPQR